MGGREAEGRVRITGHPGPLVLRAAMFLGCLFPGLLTEEVCMLEPFYRI